MGKSKVAFLCPVHMRHQFLRVAFEQFMKIPDCVKHIFYFMDRPEGKVLVELESILSIPLFEDVRVWTETMPWPIVDGQHGDFPKAWDWMMRRAVKLVQPDFCGIWDDDMVLVEPKEIRDSLEYDLVYGRKLFLWDDPAKFNDKLEHNSVVLFRYFPGDRFHPKEIMQVHAPQRVHASPREKVTELQTFVLDYGFMSAKDRKLVFDREKRTGKIDGFTRPLVERPDLKTLPYVLRDKSREFAARFKE